MSSFATRVDRARALMAEVGVDALLLSVGADLPYFTGYEAMASERLTMAVLTAGGRGSLVVPGLEAPRVESRPDVFDVVPWDETQDPVALVADLLGGPGRFALGDHTWAVFLMRLQEALPGASFVPASDLTSELRMRKDDAEVAALVAAGAAADRVAARLRTTTFSGRTEHELSQQVQAMVVAEGHDTAWEAIVAAGPNAASPHHHPGGRVISAGDTVVVDFGGRHGGYFSDTTRTFVVGEPSPEVAAAYEVLREAQEAGVAAAEPGAPAQEVDRAARAVIEEAGYGEYFVHRTGHGIGLEVHEHPYLVEGNDRPLEPGMAFSVEPGIYVPGEWGMRIEDIVVCTADGPRRLNQSPRDLAVVG